MPAASPRFGRSARVPWIPSASADEIRDHVQARLRLMAGLVFWVCLALFGFVLVLYELYPHTRPAGATLVHRLAFVGLAILGGLWAIALGRALAMATLYRLDALITLAIGGVFGLSAAVSSEQRAAVWAAFIWHTFTVLSRALIVPSTGRRTLVLSALSYVPFVAAGVGMAIEHPARLEVPPVPFVIGVILFSGMATLLATTGSRVIYGLRAEVRLARQLGQYTLDSLIARGGMGAVYRARHALLRRPTAVKLLPPDQHDAASLARFEREVQHMSQLTHPNTVAIYDYGRSPDGVFYYAMELLDGVDLEVLVHLDGALPAPRVVHVLRQLCGALDEAHGRGLIHRDVKPANVILCRRGTQPDVVKVLDFGLVTEVARDGLGAATATDAPALLGTPAYLAPEVITSPAEVGPASDLYGVGAVAYFLLTGQRVFAGATVAELCLAHVHEPPVPPSRRAAGPISAELEALVLACLAKDPAARPASAHALRAALAAVPEAEAWDEEAALGWWRAFEARRAPDAAGGAAGPRTITVDLMARATTSGELAPGGDAPVVRS
ncbi:MAG: serine/threonine protein kinase [Myxococcales bacterium]|nr:serine/threonine protein kinase [Myxococcales bacterium]